MIFRTAPALLMFVSIVGCTSTPHGPSVHQPLAESATQLLKKSAQAQAEGASTIQVGYDGNWKFFAKATQPVLTDPAYRKSSTETYRRGGNRIQQTHRGPGGIKTVSHVVGQPSPEVTYNGKKATDPEVLDAAALVAEAYALFIFGAKYALDHGQEFSVKGEEVIAGHPCHIVECQVAGGFGDSSGDLLRLSIDTDTYVCRRVYFSINGLASTQGAEVDVTMSQFVKAADGSLWPTHFYERVRKPVKAPAHEWTVTTLTVDGQKIVVSN